MQLKNYCKWIIVFVTVLKHITSTTGAQLQMDNDYFYRDPDMEDTFSAINEMQPDAKKNLYYGAPNTVLALVDPSVTAPDTGASEPHTAPDNGCDPPQPAQTAQPAGGQAASAPAAPAAPADAPPPPPPTPPPPPPSTTSSSDSSGGGEGGDAEIKAKELRILVQHLYIAQARVQLEATEIKKAQSVANAAQTQLEEAANHVRSITATLQTAQQEVAAAAIRAQTAQLQLAAHDQLLFAARQDVDALSSQMVGLQAAEGMSAPKITFDLSALLEKLRQPLPDDQKPTAVPPVIVAPTFSSAMSTSKTGKMRREAVSEDFYE